MRTTFTTIGLIFTALVSQGQVLLTDAVIQGASFSAVATDGSSGVIGFVRSAQTHNTYSAYQAMSVTLTNDAQDLLVVGISEANDFHLSASDMAAKNSGMNLSSYFTTDADGNARPSSGAWDIGPYQYEASVPSTNAVFEYHLEGITGGGFQIN